MSKCPVHYLLDSSLVNAYRADGYVTFSECTTLVITKTEPHCCASHTNQVGGEDAGALPSSNRVISE